MSGPNPRHGLAVENDTNADVNDEALVASGAQPKHGAAVALSGGAAGATSALDAAGEPNPGLEGIDV
jgi:hypothetical protein